MQLLAQTDRQEAGTMKLQTAMCTSIVAIVDRLCCDQSLSSHWSWHCRGFSEALPHSWSLTCARPEAKSQMCRVSDIARGTIKKNLEWHHLQIATHRGLLPGKTSAKAVNPWRRFCGYPKWGAASRQVEVAEPTTGISGSPA